MIANFEPRLRAGLKLPSGLPINAISDDVLHYADLAYLVGFVVAFAIYWVAARRSVSSEA